ncbi:MAG: OmpA family protein [Leptospirillia bacterium]
MNRFERIKKSFIFTVLSVVLPTLPAASFEFHPDYVVPYVGMVFVDSDRQVDDGERLSIDVGMELNGQWNIEVGGFAEKFEEQGGGKLHLGGGSIAALRYFHRFPYFSTYARGGAGGLLDNNKLNVYLEGGGGFEQPLMFVPFKVRIDMRYRRSQEIEGFSSSRGLADWMVQAGLIIPLSRPAPPAPESEVNEEEVAPPADSDGDGVSDARDRCPDTPPGMQVNAFGCPRDTDLDGIYDDVDRCAGTPLNAPVDDYGCEFDDDDDGVINRLDACPATRAGVKVDEAGCAIVKTTRLKGVNFHFNSDQLTGRAKKILDGVADNLREQRGLIIEVAGHTDDEGSDAYNLKLSHKRAASVVRYLVKKGVPQQMLEPRGYGERKPVSSNNTESGRANNRRVELRIMTMK